MLLLNKVTGGNKEDIMVGDMVQGNKGDMVQGSKGDMVQDNNKVSEIKSHNILIINKAKVI